jgi:alanine dehydrogenase
MEFGVPKEVRDLENRVGLAPGSVLGLTRAGHSVYVQAEAGTSAGFSDEDYRNAGAQIVYSAAEAYGRADVVAKIARPTDDEYRHFRNGQIIFAFFHLPVASPDMYGALVEHEITAVSYELMCDKNGQYPVLVSASEVAGRLAPTIAGQLLCSNIKQGVNGRGILLGGLASVPPASVVIIGGGTLGANAARAFLGMGAEVMVLDRDINKLRAIEERFNGRVTTMFANRYNLKRVVKFADVLVGAVLVPGQRAPILVTREMVKTMRTGSIIIDYSIDEGGCFETSRPTTLRDPIFVTEGIIHHCVPNITSTVARTTSYAISNAALPYLRALAENGLMTAVKDYTALAEGISLYQGNLVHPQLAAALGRTITRPQFVEERNQDRGGLS